MLYCSHVSSLELDADWYGLKQKKWAGKNEDGFKMAPFSSLTYKWNSGVEKSVL